jgi:hypothetical protein
MTLKPTSFLIPHSSLLIPHSSLLFLFLFSFLFSSAQLGGQSVFNSLNIQGSARVGALGGNFFAVKDGDITLAAINPSILDSTMDGKLAVSYVDYFSKTNFGFVNYGQRINQKITASASLQFFGYGKMDELDPLGNPTGSFNAGDYVLSLGAGYQVDSLWSVGANFKTIYSSIADYYSLGMALDFAATYNNPQKRFTAVALIKNVGVQLHTYTEGTREALPFEMQIGFTKRPQHAPFRFSVIYEHLEKWDLSYTNPNADLVTDPITGEVVEDRKFELGDQFMRHLVFGTEFLLTETFNIRIGYNYRRRQELKLQDKPALAGASVGLGLNLKRFQIGYARAIYHAAGPSNHFTVGFRVSGF